MEDETPTETSSSSVDKNLYFYIGLLIVGLIAIFVFVKSKSGSLTASPSPVAVATPAIQEVMVTLNELNKSSESGTATLKEVDGKVSVELNLVGAAKGVSQPAHLHKGVCPGIGAVAYPLNFPIEGQSQTTLDVSLDELKAQLPLAINVHKSASDIKTYVSCGDIIL
ncbi:MAG: hypothetical protein AAB685_00420 [Patescibacteria group bacterium]